MFTQGGLDSEYYKTSNHSSLPPLHLKYCKEGSSNGDCEHQSRDHHELTLAFNLACGKSRWHMSDCNENTNQSLQRFSSSISIFATFVVLTVQIKEWHN